MPGTWAERRHHVDIIIPEQIDFLRSGPYQFASAVLHHGDSTQSGHYTAWCWEGIAKGKNRYRWYNDNEVGDICTWEQVTSSTRANARLYAGVYIVIYTRIGFWSDEVGDGTEATPYRRDAASTQVAHAHFRGEAR